MIVLGLVIAVLTWLVVDTRCTVAELQRAQRDRAAKQAITGRP